MKEVQDIIIIGGGPVGSFAALMLSKLGKKVAVFEEHEEIGQPNHCAGHLSINSLKLLGLYPLPHDIIENEFSKATFYSHDGECLPIELSKPVTCVVNRKLFDKHIFHKAKNAGVRFHLNSRVKSLLIENGFVKGVKTSWNDSEKTFRSKIVLDAEGISSRLLKQTTLTPLNPTKLVYAVNAQVENLHNLQSDKVHVYFGKSYAPGFYAWVIPKLDGTANVGLATNNGNPNIFLKKLMFDHPIASLHLSQAIIKNKQFHSIPLGGPIPKLYLNGFMALGDVASLVKPTTGGGIIFGLRSSIIASQVASQAINNKDLSENFLKQYQHHYMKTFNFDFQIMLRMRAFFNSLSDKKFSKMLRFFKKTGFNKSLRSIDEIDLQGRALFKAIIKPKVSITMVYLLINYILTNSLNSD